MEARIIHTPKRLIRTLSLSIAALLFLVNARASSLPSVNSAAPQPKTAKPPKDFSRLVQTLLAKGTDWQIGPNLAPAIGLDKPSPTKTQDVIISEKETEAERRSCIVVLNESDGKSSPTPMCLFVRRTKRTPNDQQSWYYKVSLSGKLEKAVSTEGKLDDKGAVIQGSGVIKNIDIASAEIKKEFDAEMAYWLKDWLKKESKKAPSKSASVAPVAKAASAPL